MQQFLEIFEAFGSIPADTTSLDRSINFDSVQFYIQLIINQQYIINKLKRRKRNAKNS